MELTDNVRVILTKCGSDIINQYIDKHNEIRKVEDHLELTKEGDAYEHTLHVLFIVFGDHLGVHNEAPFTNLEKI